MADQATGTGDMLGAPPAWPCGPASRDPTTETAQGSESPRWEGLTGDELARRLGVPRVALYDAVGSTMDVAHAMAAQGAAAGTVVLADQQSAGRGRGGHGWVSQPASGIWMTLVERPTDAATVEVWAVRHGLSAARALDPYASDPITLKWPNDLYIGSGKVAGILIEAQWQDQRVLWVAVGIGINVRPPAGVPAPGALRPGTSRLEALCTLVPALRLAAQMVGGLTAAELQESARRDRARGRTCREPAIGRVVGIGARGELLLETAAGVRAFRSGSLVLDNDTEAA